MSAYSGTSIRLYPVSTISGTFTLTAGGSVVSTSYASVGLFPRLVIRTSSTSIGCKLIVTYMDDNSVTYSQPAVPITTTISTITSNVIAKNVMLVIIPPSSGPSAVVYIDSYLSSSKLDDTIAGVTVEGIPKNITSYRNGELAVGRYDGSLRQQITQPEHLLTLSRDIGFGIFNRPASVATAYNAGRSVVTTTTNQAIAVSANSAPYGSLDDTFILRFNFIPMAGTCRIVFGDSEFGVGMNSGSFGITWNYGTQPLVYFMPVNFASNASACTVTLDDDVFAMPITNPENIPQEFAKANQLLGSPMMLSARNQIFYARRLTPIKTAGTVSITNPCFMTSPLVSTRNQGAGVEWLLSSNFNIDIMNGTGNIPNYDGSTPIAGELIFTSAGDYLLMIADTTGRLSPVHRGKSTSPLFTGTTSRLTMYVSPSSSVSIADISLYGYRSITGQPKSVELPTNWYTWNNHPANSAGAGVFASGYWYLSNIFVISQTPIIHRIRVHTDYKGTIYLLTNTCAYTGGTEILSDGVILSVYDNASYGGNQYVYPSLYTSNVSVRGLQSSGSSVIYDAVIATAPVIDGVAIFENVSFDYGSGGTIGIDSHFRGNVSARVSVDYYI